MTTPTDYVLQLKAKLAISPTGASFNVIEEKVWPDRGYIRIWSFKELLRKAGVTGVIAPVGEAIHD